MSDELVYFFELFILLPDVYKRQAYYYFIHFDAEADVPGEIEQRIRIMDNVIRYLCVRQEA